MGVSRVVRAYLCRWARQVGRQLWSFGRDQAVGLILAILIFLYQLHSGLIQGVDLKKTGIETIAYPYLTLAGLYLLFEIVRAPYLLDRDAQDALKKALSDNKSFDLEERRL